MYERAGAEEGESGRFGGGGLIVKKGPKKLGVRVSKNRPSGEDVGDYSQTSGKKAQGAPRRGGKTKKQEGGKRTLKSCVRGTKRSHPGLPRCKSTGWGGAPHKSSAGIGDT